jgi:glycosyltransferase involved in cell wall biosynthesis
MLATLPTLTAAGFEIHLAAPNSGPLAELLNDLGILHVVWQTRDAHGERLPLEQLRTDLAVLIRNVSPDLLHANSLSTSRIAGPVAFELNKPSIGHLRDIIKLNRQAIDDINAHRRLLAVSCATRDFHVSQGLAAQKCHVAFNGVDLDRFRPRSPTGYIHREIGLPSSARLIATIGQLGLRKGTDVVLSAARHIADEVPDVQWLIVGERTSNKTESREFEESLISIAAEPPLAGRVNFLGRRTDIDQLLNECTLVAHAARQEPLGRVLLESAASGTPVVATNVGGTHEIFPTIHDGAVLVSPDNRSAFAAAMLGLLRDDARRQSLAAGARNRAETAFDIRATATQLVAHYEQTLA